MSPIRYIRIHVFGLTQKEFAAIAKVGQASVSRWENGCPLSSDEMHCIREEARSRSLDWDDRWFFEAPATGTGAAA